jgi:cytoskeletal protein CcmA (bactofilin family)
MPETPLPEPLETLPLVPAGGFFEGQIAVAADTRIDGRVAGTLRGNGRLEVGPRARIEGQVECEELIVYGTVIGPISAHRRTRLEAGAHVDGDVLSPALEVVEEAVWNGVARIGRSTSEASERD